VDSAESPGHASAGAGGTNAPAGMPGIPGIGRMPDTAGAGVAYGVLGDAGPGARGARWGRVGNAWAKERGMGDLVYVALIVAFLVVMLGYAVACEKL
jgi:hypothetical protein